MALNLRHQTAVEFASRFWDAVRAARAAGNQVEYGRLLWWLERKLVAGDITDTGARTTFNTAFGKALSAAQWTTLRTSRIKVAHDRYAALLAEGDL